MKNKSIGAEYSEGLSKPKESMSMHESMMKGLKDMKVGDECEVCVKGKITEMEDTEYSNGMRARMEISSMKKMEK